jgi:hypothetical protein
MAYIRVTNCADVLLDHEAAEDGRLREKSRQIWRDSQERVRWQLGIAAILP